MNCLWVTQGRLFLNYRCIFLGTLLAMAESLASPLLSSTKISKTWTEIGTYYGFMAPVGGNSQVSPDFTLLPGVRCGNGVTGSGSLAMVKNWSRRTTFSRELLIFKSPL